MSELLAMQSTLLSHSRFSVVIRLHRAVDQWAAMYVTKGPMRSLRGHYHFKKIQNESGGTEPSHN